jgi:hypothetical protein
MEVGGPLPSLVFYMTYVFTRVCLNAMQLWAGNPAKFVRDLTDEEKENIYINATVRSHMM